MTVDPWEVNNLAGDPQYAEILERMRGETGRWMNEIRDTGLMPEGEMSTRNQTDPSFNYVHSDAYSIENIKHAADIATMRDANNLDEIISFIHDDDPIVRYWGATGCLILGEASNPAKEDLIALLKDENPDVRITAAEALCNLNESEIAGPILIEALDEDNLMVRVHALNSLEILGGETAKSAIPKVKEMVGDQEGREYDLRAAIRLIEIYD